MEIKVKKISELPAKQEIGHEGFVARSLVTLLEKGIAVRLINVAPGGIGPVTPHSHPDIHFFLVLEGTLELEIDGQLYTVPGGSCVEVPPGKTHQLRCRGPKEMKVLAIKWT